MLATTTVLLASNGWGKSKYLRQFSYGQNPFPIPPGRHPDGRTFGFVGQSTNCPMISNNVVSLLETQLVVAGRSVREARTQVQALLERFGFGHLEKASVSHLSGGEDRIVQLLAGIIQSPSRLIVDDPFGMLDAKRKKEVLVLLREYLCPQNKPQLNRHLLLAMPDSDSSMVKELSTVSHMFTYSCLKPRVITDLVDTIDRLSGPTERNVADILVTNVSMSTRNREIMPCWSTHLCRGQVHLLRGPNATGKSLLLKAIAGRLPRTVSLRDGHFSVAGIQHYGRKRQLTAEKLILVPQDCTQILMSVDPLEKAIYLSSIGGSVVKQLIEILLDYKMIWGNRPVIQASVGESRFVTVLLASLAALVRPEVHWFLLDEPDAYLDNERRVLLSHLLAAIARSGKGVLVVSHHPDIYKHAKEVSICA